MSVVTDGNTVTLLPPRPPAPPEYVIYHITVHACIAMPPVAANPNPSRASRSARSALPATGVPVAVAVDDNFAAAPQAAVCRPAPAMQRRQGTLDELSKFLVASTEVESHALTLHGAGYGL